MPTMQELVREAVEKGASDLHLSAGGPPRLRVDGDLVPTKHPALDAAGVSALVNAIVTEEQRRHFESEHELDFSWTVPDVGRFRVNVFLQGRGPGAVLRTIPTKIPSLESLMMPPILTELCKRERGLVLVTGPTGSGKSTTLAAMVDLVNATWDAHILTIEDPVEFVHESNRCLVNQREVGAHTDSFSNALRAALREDPDVILVGEMRDLETISLALTAAETGHLVFGTLHTSSAAKTIDRIIDVFPAGQQNQIRAMLSESLEAVIAQRLLKRKGGGRVAACEILVGNPAVRNLIREGKLHQIPSAMQTGQQSGMVTMDMAIAELVKKGLVEREAPAPRPALNGGTTAAAAPQ
jgi:twitching motility protein PilT